MTPHRGRSGLPPPPVAPMSGESDFWAGLFVDLAVRVEWLAQALDALPTEDASAAAVVRLRSYAQALEELHASLDRVQRHRADPELKPLFVLDGPLAGFLSRLYAWCEEIGSDYERMATALRRHEPTSVVFSHKSVNKSYAHFDALIAAVRRWHEGVREHHEGKHAAKWRGFSEAVEELVWATEWVHLALARRPGE